MCMLFCPKMEVRANKTQRKLIGALCGLDEKPDTNTSICREQDLLVNFDVEFDEADINKINATRYLIGLICEIDSEESLDCLRALQNGIKQQFTNKCREWEKERRVRFQLAFESLAKVLPSYDPSRALNKLEILQLTQQHILELQKKNKQLICDKAEAETVEEYLQLLNHVKNLVARIDQLVVLLKKQNIKIPKELITEPVSFLPKKLYSARVNEKNAKILSENFINAQKKKDEQEKISAHKPKDKQKNMNCTKNENKKEISDKTANKNNRNVKCNKKKQTDKLSLNYTASNHEKIPKNPDNNAVLTNSTTSSISSTLPPGILLFKNGQIMSVVPANVSPTKITEANPQIKSNENNPKNVILLPLTTDNTTQINNTHTVVTNNFLETNNLINLVSLLPIGEKKKVTNEKVPIPALPSSNYLRIIKKTKKKDGDAVQNESKGKSKKNNDFKNPTEKIDERMLAKKKKAGVKVKILQQEVINSSKNVTNGKDGRNQDDKVDKSNGENNENVFNGSVTSNVDELITSGNKLNGIVEEIYTKNDNDNRQYTIDSSKTTENVMDTNNKRKLTQNIVIKTTDKDSNKAERIGNDERDDKISAIELAQAIPDSKKSSGIIEMQKKIDESLDNKIEKINEPTYKIRNKTSDQTVEQTINEASQNIISELNDLNGMNNNINSTEVEPNTDSNVEPFPSKAWQEPRVTTKKKLFSMSTFNSDYKECDALTPSICSLEKNWDLSGNISNLLSFSNTELYRKCTAELKAADVDHEKQGDKIKFNSCEFFSLVDCDKPPKENFSNSQINEVDKLRVNYLSQSEDKTSELLLNVNYDLSNDMFQTIPPPELSPTAAFLLSFPIVNSKNDCYNYNQEPMYQSKDEMKISASHKKNEPSSKEFGHLTYDDNWLLEYPKINEKKDYAKKKISNDKGKGKHKETEERTKSEKYLDNFMNYIPPIDSFVTNQSQTSLMGNLPVHDSSVNNLNYLDWSENTQTPAQMTNNDSGINNQNNSQSFCVDSITTRASSAVNSQFKFNIETITSKADVKRNVNRSCMFSSEELKNDKQYKSSEIIRNDYYSINPLITSSNLYDPPISSTLPDSSISSNISTIPTPSYIPPPFSNLLPSSSSVTFPYYFQSTFANSLPELPPAVVKNKSDCIYVTSNSNFTGKKTVAKPKQSRKAVNWMTEPTKKDSNFSLNNILTQNDGRKEMDKEETSKSTIDFNNISSFFEDFDNKDYLDNTNKRNSIKSELKTKKMPPSKFLSVSQLVNESNKPNESNRREILPSIDCFNNSWNCQPFTSTYSLNNIFSNSNKLGTTQKPNQISNYSAESLIANVSNKPKSEQVSIENFFPLTFDDQILTSSEVHSNIQPFNGIESISDTNDLNFDIQYDNPSMQNNDFYDISSITFNQTPEKHLKSKDLKLRKRKMDVNKGFMFEAKKSRVQPQKTFGQKNEFSRAVSLQNNAASNVLTNFNLSTIFPEIVKDDKKFSIGKNC